MASSKQSWILSAILFFLFTIWHSAFAASEESEWTKASRAVDEINKKSGKRILKWVTNERTSYVDVYYPDLIRIPGRNFEISRTEVTQAQWFVMMGNKPSHFSNCGADCPVENMSWDDIQAYLQKLRDMTGMQYRLPTEAEWKYACYGGSQTKYCGSNDPNAVGWYEDNSNGKTHPVGRKQSNGYGLYDMTGNVDEFTFDCFAGDCDKWRVVLGGSWIGEPEEPDNHRSGGWRTSGYNLRGFRVARTLP